MRRGDRGRSDLSIGTVASTGGDSLRKIAADLDAAGAPTAQGGVK